MKKYFFRKENGTYTWIGPELKLVFSNLSFQANDEYGFLESVNGILYLYYTIEIYAKQYSYDDEGEEIYSWRFISKKNTYDFPTITELQYILKQYLENKVSIDECRLIHYYHCGEIMKDRIGYIHSMDTGSSFYDDCYQIERIIDKEHNREISRNYYLYAGCSIDPQGGGASVGIKTRISEGGLRCLYQCITEFLNEGIQKHNNINRETLSKAEYSIDKNNRLLKIENGKITQLFLEGEEIDSVCIYVGDLNSENFHSESYNNVILSKFNKNEVTIKNGYCKHGNENYNNLKENRMISFPTKNIIYVFTKIEEPILSLNEENIAEDFRKVLTEEELNQIKISTLEEMYQKWYEVIVNRYIIFRDEHHFKSIKEDKIENKKEAINTILKLLK